jgi:hypothetical protein
MSMLRSSLFALLCLALAWPGSLPAESNMEVLESVAAAKAQVQPGLQNYLATVETPHIQEIATRLTNAFPADVTPPMPVIIRFWQRNGTILVFSEETQLPPYVEQLVKLLADNLSAEPLEMLLPADRAEQRRALVKGASVMLSEVVLADNLTRRLEISFAKPTDLNGAFYVAGMHLPQEGISQLVFDIDSKTDTVSELLVASGNQLRLTAEIRYLDVSGGYLPERIKITSPDGKIDDLFEIRYTEVDSYLLPASMHHVIRRTAREETLEIFFKDYKVNQPVPESLQARLKGL